MIYCGLLLSLLFTCQTPAQLQLARVCRSQICHTSHISVGNPVSPPTPQVSWEEAAQWDIIPRYRETQSAQRSRLCRASWYSFAQWPWVKFTSELQL